VFRNNVGQLSERPQPSIHPSIELRNPKLFLYCNKKMFETNENDNKKTPRNPLENTPIIKIVTHKNNNGSDF
jgi:hypothetical protein